MKDYIGKKMEMLIDGQKLTFEVINVLEYEIIAKSKDKVVHIPLNKIGMYSVAGEKINDFKAKKRTINIYMCKNDVVDCSGVKMLSLKDDLTIDCIACKFNKNEDCEFAKVGNLYDLPPEIQLAFLNGMATPTAPISIDNKKGEKNVKQSVRTNRKNK